MKKTKYIKPKMEFNPGKQKYEPVLTIRKKGKRIKISWLEIIIVIISMISLLAIVIYLGRFI